MYTKNALAALTLGAVFAPAMSASPCDAMTTSANRAFGDFLRRSIPVHQVMTIEIPDAFAARLAEQKANPREANKPLGLINTMKPKSGLYSIRFEDGATQVCGGRIFEYDLGAKTGSGKVDLQLLLDVRTCTSSFTGTTTQYNSALKEKGRGIIGEWTVPAGLDRNNVSTLHHETLKRIQGMCNAPR